MSIENRIWDLASKKLADEASEQELHELDELLQQHPAISRKIQQLFNWWFYDEEQNAVNRSEHIFNKIKEKIKQAEKSRPS